MNPGPGTPVFIPQKETTASKVYDLYHRPLRDVRISVIDQCNFRCTYCMPANSGTQPYTFLKKDQWLSFGQIERLAVLFVRLGVGKIRLTGGEPLLRPGLPELIKRLKRIDKLYDLALTTNGSRLSGQAQTLKDAGLDRITISLDTIDPELFRRINGYKGSLERVLEGIDACEKAGFECIKINVVLQKEISHRHILDLVRYFKCRKPILRFIEYMDVGNCNHWRPEAVVPASQIVKAIDEHFPLRAAQSNYYGEVAARYEFVDGSGEIGFITSITQPFCRTCTRTRLSAEGKMYTCLFASQGIDLKALLNKNISDDELLAVLRLAWEKRDDRYSELRAQWLPKTNGHPKVEMFQIGG